jgi:hypothetical protein
MLDEFYTPIEKVPVVNRLIGREGITSGQIAVHLPFWFSSNDPHLWYPIDAVNVDSLSMHMTIRNITGTLQTDISGGSAPVQWNTDCSGVYIKTPGSGESNPGFDPDDPDATYTETAFVPPPLGDSYLLVEYIYLDRYEANRLRVSPIEIPIPQHTILPVVKTSPEGDTARIPLRIGNPTKSLLFFAKRSAAEHPFANTSNATTLPSSSTTWATCDEPVKEIALAYENNQIRYNTTFTDLFRILMPSLECTKSPYYSNYFYYMGFDVANHELRLGIPCGEANLDRVSNVELRLHLRAGPDGKYDYDIYVYAITYNILHIYGGRAGLLFAY